MIFRGRRRSMSLKETGRWCGWRQILGAAAGTYYYNDENQAIDHLFIAVGAAGGHYRGGTAGVMRYDGERVWGGRTMRR